MAKIRFGKPKTDPEIKRCAKCDCVLAFWESEYGGVCHVCYGLTFEGIMKGK